MLDNLRKYNIILASNSPRRKELLKGLGLDFEVKTISGIDESYPEYLHPHDVAQYISGKKAAAYMPYLTDESLLVTADTIVCCDNEILGKPKDAEDARRMLHCLSGKTHEVVTGVSITTKKHQTRFSTMSKVTFSDLTDEEINYYVDGFCPLDKAGAYGIQEWIGYVGVVGIEGSFYNVMGLPVQRLYAELKKIQ